MSWLQQRPQVSRPTNFFTVGLNKTLLVVGLGNPGNEFIGTRHNIGFDCAETLVKNFEEFSGWANKKDLKCLLSSGQLGDKRIIVIKPTTFMNNSGEAVSLVTNFYKVELSKIMVMHDELDIDFGNIRTRIGGSSGGHNGIKSITKLLGDEGYGRIRIGIGPKTPASIDSKDFVLQKFSQQENAQLTHLKNEVTALLTENIYGSGDLFQETRSFIV
jgi:PTH1 family peptidyl-tRNA hydrolase